MPLFPFTSVDIKSELGIIFLIFMTIAISVMVQLAYD